MEKSYSFHDVLIGVLSKLSTPRGEFWYDSERTHKFFYKKRDNYSILNDLRFDWDGRYPTSSVIGDAFDGLHVTRLLTSMSPDFNPHFAGPACKLGFERFSMQRFSKKELEEIVSLAKEFEEEFSNRKVNH